MINDFSLSNKSILITGASSGIGVEVSLLAGNHNANLLLVGRNKERLQSTYNKLTHNSGSKILACDLGLSEDLEQIATVSEELDGLVLNAGIIKINPIQFLKLSEIDDLFNVNIKSSIILIQKLLKKKKLKKGASIVFVSSIATQKSTVGNTLYTATKGAVNSFTKSLALELAGKRIRVNAVLPGLVKTNLLGGDIDTNHELESHLINYPLGRFGEPKDIALLIQYLLSDASSWMTGSLIPIDGGFSLK